MCLDGSAVIFPREKKSEESALNKKLFKNDATSHQPRAEHLLNLRVSMRPTRCNRTVLIVGKQRRVPVCVQRQMVHVRTLLVRLLAHCKSYRPRVCRMGAERLLSLMLSCCLMQSLWLQACVSFKRVRGSVVASFCQLHQLSSRQARAGLSLQTYLLRPFVSCSLLVFTDTHCAGNGIKSP